MSDLHVIIDGTLHGTRHIMTVNGTIVSLTRSETRYVVLLGLQLRYGSTPWLRAAEVSPSNPTITREMTTKIRSRVAIACKSGELGKSFIRNDKRCNYRLGISPSKFHLCNMDDFRDYDPATADLIPSGTCT